jgi:hypothetical protein
MSHKVALTGDVTESGGKMTIAATLKMISKALSSCGHTP